jgi:hypothetical protein
MGQFTTLGLLMILPTFVVMYLDLFGLQCKNDSKENEETVYVKKSSNF